MIKPCVNLEIDKTRRLRFNSRVISILEHKFDMGAFKYFKSFETKGEDIRTEEIVTLLWLSLLWEDKDLTLDEAFDLYDIAMEKNGVEKVFTSIFESLANFFGIDLQQEIKMNPENIKKKQTKSKKK